MDFGEPILHYLLSTPEQLMTAEGRAKAIEDGGFLIPSISYVYILHYVLCLYTIDLLNRYKLLSVLLNADGNSSVI